MRFNYISKKFISKMLVIFQLLTIVTNAMEATNERPSKKDNLHLFSIHDLRQISVDNTPKTHAVFFDIDGVLLSEGSPKKSEYISTLELE